MVQQSLGKKKNVVYDIVDVLSLEVFNVRLDGGLCNLI